MAYEKLLRALPEADRLAETEELRNRQKELDKQAEDVIGFKNGSVWEGTRFAFSFNNLGAFNQGEEPFALKVVKVEGEILDGEASFNINIAIAQVRGNFDGFRVSWATVRMIKMDGAYRDWKIEGVILGNTLYARFVGNNINQGQGIIGHLEGCLLLKRRD